MTPSSTPGGRHRAAFAAPPTPLAGARSLSRPERRIVAYEREAEQLAIGQALDAAAAGHGGLVIIEGPVGAGRSLLLQLAAQAASHKGFEVLKAKASADEKTFAYGVARQLLEARVLQATTVERQRLFASSAGVTAPLFGVKTSEPPIEGAERQHRTAHGLAWLIHNISRIAPTLVIVDDAELADEESMRALSRLNQRLSDLSIVVLLVMQEGSHRSATSSADELRVHASARVLRIGPLSLAGVTRLARKRFFPKAPDAFCRELAHRCGGLPALVAEVLAALDEARLDPADPASEIDLRTVVPAKVVGAVGNRLAQLPPDAVPLARAVAVLGDGTTLAHAAILARLEGSRPSLALDALVRAGLLVAEGSGLRYTTPLFAAAARETIPPAERSRTHLQAARLLRGQGADDDDIAAHLLSAQASGDRWSVAVLERAAIGALARSEPELAVRYLERAVAEPPPPDRQGPIMAMLGQAEVVAGMSTAAERFRAAAGLLVDPAERAAVFDDLGRRLLLNGAAADAAVAFSQGLDAVGDPNSDVALRLLAGLLRTVHLDPSLRERWKHRLALPPTGEGVDLQLQSPAGRALLALVYLDRLQDGAARTLVRSLCRRLGEAIDASPNPEREAATRCDLGLALLLCGDAPAGEEVLTAALDTARSPGLRLSIAVRRLQARLVQGRLIDAEADAVVAVREATSVAATAGPTPATVTAASLLCLVRIEQGRLRLAADALAETTNQEVPGGVAAQEVAAGWLALAVDQPEEARDHFVKAGAASHPLAILTSDAGAALALHRCGRTDEARSLAEQHLVRTRDGMLPWVVAEAKRVLGTVTAGAEGASTLRSAADTARTGGAHLELAKAEVALGAALVMAGDRAEGVRHLRAGLATATACGADGLVEQAFHHLRPTAATAAQGAPTVELTANERRVTGLAAAGRTNQDIAEELLLGVGHVQWFLRNGYRKLGVSSRHELGGVLRSGRIGIEHHRDDAGASSGAPAPATAQA